MLPTLIAFGSNEFENEYKESLDWVTGELDIDNTEGTDNSKSEYKCVKAVSLVVRVQ